MPPAESLAALGFAALWLIAALASPIVRHALGDGLRCVARYPDFWRLPALLGLAYALFQIAATALLHARMHDPFPLVAPGSMPSWAALALSGWLPAAERTAAVFTIFNATFPLSAWFALLFVVNGGSLLAELTLALRKRLGNARGLLLSAALFVCALAAMAKPGVYLFLPEVADHVPVTILFAINLFSSGFELLLGIFFLTYLMLMAHAWRRGLHFERINLRLLAMRRTGVVIRWSLALLALAGGFVFLPIYLGLLVAPGEPFYGQCEWFSAWIGRPIVTLVALFFLSTQAILVFHNESLRPALREARRFFLRHALAIAPFLLVVYAPFFALEISADAGNAWLGEETVAALGARVIIAFAEALLAGWLIASWVCLYKSLSAGRKEIPF